jgi:glutamate synthase (NADPH/NADH) large chain
LIAETRHTPRGIDLISPSNNHDIYSIEDLAQVIEELKTANPHAKVSVKIPAVPFIGPIATGIARRTQTLSRSADSTVVLARRASTHCDMSGCPSSWGQGSSSGAAQGRLTRTRRDLADGGHQVGPRCDQAHHDGANRVGFGTMAMAAVGCTSCRECNTGTCHVGITSHIPRARQLTRWGVKKFHPRDYEKSVDGLVTFFTNVINEVGMLTMRLGFTRTQDLVGRSDLMKQTRGLDLIDLDYDCSKGN